MSTDGPFVPHTDTTTTRLVGWKEISAYLRRSIRTVQRWEHESDLPIRRYPTKRGEGVFAWPEELDAWLKSASGAAADDDGEGAAEAAAPAAGMSRSGHGGIDSDGVGEGPVGGNQRVGVPDAVPQPATTVSRRLWFQRVPIAVLTFIVLAIFLAVVFETPGRGPLPQPVSAKVVGEDIVAFDAVGKLLWKYSLDRPMVPTAFPGKQVLVEDLDGDGGREVFVVLGNSEPQFDSVICLEANGRKRWSRRPDRRAEYGHGPMGPPWVPLFVRATGTGSHKSFWVSWANSPFFGAFVERLDVKTGKPTAVYWSAGYIYAMAVAELRGRPVLLLGACNNEHAAASLAVYDLAVTEASAPATERKFACLDCPAGRPIAFYVFPKTALSRELTAENAPLKASGINVTDTEVIVNIEHTPEALPPANAIYRFDRNLNLMGGETIDTYRTFHRELERQGKLNAPYSEAEERQLFPVLSWDGTRFVEIAAANNKP